MIIAVDGPAAAGKGTIARRLAAHFGYDHLETGLLYRAVGLRILRRGGDPSDPAEAAAEAAALTPADLGNTALSDPALRDEATANAATCVAVHAEIRAMLLAFQREFASNPPGGKGAVLDGRDIGTTVCPDAEVKLFLTASLETRARRRLQELQARGVDSINSRVLRDMKERDTRDRERDVAPLMPAEDAFVLDTDGLDADQVFTVALDFATSRDQAGRN